MSGADPQRKMKRKRKTRAERNQMSRHHLQDQDKQKKLTKSSNDMEPCRNAIYTLRSGRGSNLSLVPRDDRQARGGTITQGRLTRSLGKLSFTNSKTSDWITRGPISESEAMKKKVESDIKRILRLAEKSTLTRNTDFDTCCLPGATNKTDKDKQTAEAEPDVMEVDCPNNSSAADKHAPEASHQKEVTGEINVSTSTTVVTSSAEQAQVTPMKSGNSFAWASTSPNNADETLELEPAVQEIADTILRELKPKFARMFPNRDIEMEICSDLQKLLNHSCCLSEDVQVDPTLNCYLPPELHNSENVCTPGIGVPTTCSSTLSVCRPPRRFQTRQLYSQLHHAEDEEDKHESNGGSVLIQDSILYPLVNTYSSTTFHKDGVPPSFTTTFLVPNIPEVEDVIKINVNVDESEDDDNDILSTARYNAFLASARELELEQERLLHQVNTFEGATPSHVSNYRQCFEQHNFLRRPCGFKSDDPSSNTSRDLELRSRPFDWRNVRAARVLDFSQPSGSSCPSRSVSEGVCPSIHVCHSVMGHNGSQFDYLINNGSEQTQCSFVNQRCSPSSVYTYNVDKRWAGPESYSSPVSNFVRRNTAPKIGLCLAQSRLNFQNALKCACKGNDPTHVKPTELMDTDGCDDFLSSIQRKSSPRQSCDLLGCRPLMVKPLTELQGHQADLQRQARDFLEDLNRCGAKPRHDFINCQSTSHARHLFRMASPDSSGSPVWGMLPVMKDFSMETGSFV